MSAGTHSTASFTDEIREMEQQVERIEARIASLKDRLPAHSIQPSMIAELDELDEALAEARRYLQEARQKINQGEK